MDNKVRVLSNIIDSLSEVLNENSKVFTKGYRTELTDANLSVTFMDQGNHYDSYIVSEPTNSSIQDSINIIEEVVDEISDDDYNISTVEDNWAEVTIKLNDEKIRNMNHYSI